MTRRAVVGVGVVRLSIGAKVLLGTSIILAMGLVCMLTIYRGLTTVQESLDEVVMHHAPATEVAFRLAHDVDGIGFHVMRYLRGDGESARKEARTGLSSFTRSREKFVRQAASVDRQELVRRLEPLADRYASLAGALVDSRSRAGNLTEQGQNEIRQMDRLLNGLLPAIDMSAPDGYEKDVNAKSMLDVLNGLTYSISDYLDDPSPARAGQIDLACNRFETYVARFLFLRLSPAERQAGRQLRTQFNRFRSRLLDDRQVQKRIEADAQAFIQARSDIDKLLEKEIERLSERDLVGVRDRADRASADVAKTVTVLLPLLFLLGLFLAVVITRMVTNPVRKLMEGTAAVREGDLTCRIVHKSHDEFAGLADNFNRMVEQLQHTTVSRDRLEASEQKLLQLNSELEVASRRKNEFLAMLGHELRNPLGAISNAVELMRLRAADSAPVKRPLEVLGRQVGHMGRLVDDLLDVSRITRGKIELRHREVELLPLVEDAAVAVAPLMNAKGHRLRLTLPQEEVRVFGDPTRLEQILINLLSNAAKYTEPGGSITLTVDLESASGITGQHSNASEWVTVTVADNGIGIEPEMLARVFELFTQSDRALDRSQGGLGIGLTLVRGLVELHGGTIEARSPGVGFGSEFIVRLPALGSATDLQRRGPSSETRTASAVLEAGAGAASGVPSLSPIASLGIHGVAGPAQRRALIVDDNVDAAESLKEILEDWGWQITLAHNGLSAVELAATSGAEVVLLDIGLPGIDGYEVARRLRERAARDEASAALLLIALTGYGQDEDVERARKAGFDYHLVKPVDLDHLRTLLDDRALTPA